MMGAEGGRKRYMWSPTSGGLQFLTGYEDLIHPELSPRWGEKPGIWYRYLDDISDYGGGEVFSGYRSAS